MSLFNTFNHPNWRYKLMWFGLSAAITLLVWAGSPPEHPGALLVFGAWSTALAAGVIAWYAILVGAEKLAAAYLAGRDSSLGLFGAGVVIWLTAAFASVTCAWLLQGQWSVVSGQGLALMIALALIVFVTAMRTMDLRDDSLATITVAPRPVRRAANHGRFEHSLTDLTSTFPNTEILDVDRSHHM